MENLMKNIFKFLSLSLLMCPLFSSAMEPENHAPERMLLSIANQSDQPIHAFITAPITVQPYEDQDNVVPKNGSAIIFTQLGMFTLSPDDIHQPMSLVLSQNEAGHENQDLVVQEMPYHKANNIVVIVNPNGSVSLAQADAGYAEEKMNAIKQSNYNNDNLEENRSDAIEKTMESLILWEVRLKAQIPTTQELIEKGHMIQELINRGYNPTDVWSLEHGAIYTCPAIFSLFIDNGANPNYVFHGEEFPNAYWTPILKVIAYGSYNSMLKATMLEITQILLDAGANINQTSNIEWFGVPFGSYTPIELAKTLKLDFIVKFLAERGAQI